jgi:hypothetical protein
MLYVCDRIYVVVRNGLVGARVVVLILGSHPNQVGFTNLCMCSDDLTKRTKISTSIGWSPAEYSKIPLI